MSALTRFDVPPTVTAFLARAMELGVVDPADLLCLSDAHGRNWTAMLDEVMEWAYASRHQGTVHREMCKVNDSHYAALHAASAGFVLEDRSGGNGRALRAITASLKEIVG